MYTVKDAEREIKEAIKNGEGGIYSFINDVNYSAIELPSISRQSS